MAGAGKNSLQLLRQIVEFGTKSKGFETILKKIKVVSGGNGRCVCKLNVTEDDQNRGGTLHGGVIATLVDSVSTWALLTSEKEVAGVSVDMNISFMKAAKIGEEITIDAQTLKLGNRLAFLTVDITNKNGVLIAQGKHTKFIGS